MHLNKWSHWWSPEKYMSCKNVVQTGGYEIAITEKNPQNVCHCIVLCNKQCTTAGKNGVYIYIKAQTLYLCFDNVLNFQAITTGT